MNCEQQRSPHCDWLREKKNKVDNRQCTPGINAKRECLKLILNEFAVTYSAISVKKENETFNQFSYWNILRSGWVNCTLTDRSQRIFVVVPVFSKNRFWQRRRKVRLLQVLLTLFLIMLRLMRRNFRFKDQYMNGFQKLLLSAIHVITKSTDCGICEQQAVDYHRIVNSLRVFQSWRYSYKFTNIIVRRPRLQEAGRQFYVSAIKSIINSITVLYSKTIFFL